MESIIYCCIFVDIFKLTNMKRFAFSVNVRCSTENEIRTLKRTMLKLGYDFSQVYPETAKYQIDVFDLELLQDILAACINEKWQENEPYIDKYGFFNGGKNSVNINNICGKNVAETDAIRPTIEQICEEHGYMLDGPNIIKKDPQERQIIKKKLLKILSEAIDPMTFDMIKTELVEQILSVIDNKD